MAQIYQRSRRSNVSGPSPPLIIKRKSTCAEIPLRANLWCNRCQKNQDLIIMKSSGKKLSCDQPWTEYSVGKEMSRQGYHQRRALIFVAHPEIRMVELGAPAPQVRMVELDAPAPLVRLVELDAPAPQVQLVELDAPAPQIIELDVPAPQVLMVELGAQDDPVGPDHESDDPDDESVWDEDTDAAPPQDDLFGSEDEEYYGGRIEAARFRRYFLHNGVPQDAEVAGADEVDGAGDHDNVNGGFHLPSEAGVKEERAVEDLQDVEVSN